MIDRALKVLGIIYPPESIYLRDVTDYSIRDRSVTGQFNVPQGHSYTHKPFGYVTAEQYIRCLSQLSYVLIGLMVEDQHHDFSFTNYQTFERLMAEQKMWFRRSDLRYLKNTAKDTDFKLTLNLKEIANKRVFSVLVIKIGGAIAGELEFVAPFAARGTS